MAKQIPVTKKETKIFNTRLAKVDREALESKVELFGLESQSDSVRMAIRVVDNLFGNELMMDDYSGMSVYGFIKAECEALLDDNNRLINRYEGGRTLSG